MPASAGRRALEVEGEGLITLGTFPQPPQGDIPIKLRLRLRPPHKRQGDPISSSDEEENLNSDVDDTSDSGSGGSSTSCGGNTSSSGAEGVRGLKGRWRRCLCCGCFTYEVAVGRHCCPRHGHSSSGRRRSGQGPDNDDPPSPRTREAITRLVALRTSQREMPPLRLPTPPNTPPAQHGPGRHRNNAGSSQNDGSGSVKKKDSSPTGFKVENTSSSSSGADLLWSGESGRLQETPSDRSQQTSDSYLVRRQVRYPLHSLHEARGHSPRTKPPSGAVVNSRLLTLRVPSRTARGHTQAPTHPRSTYHSHCGEQHIPGPRRLCSLRAATLHRPHPRSLLLADTPSAPSERQRRQDADPHPPALSLSGLGLHQRPDHNH